MTTAPAPATTETARPVVVYWRCPVCGVEVMHGFITSGHGWWVWSGSAMGPLRALEDSERRVEAHEARHGIGAA